MLNYYAIKESVASCNSLKIIVTGASCCTQSLNEELNVWRRVKSECLNIAQISLHFNKHIREVNILPFKYLCTYVKQQSQPIFVLCLFWENQFSPVVTIVKMFSYWCLRCPGVWSLLLGRIKGCIMAITQAWVTRGAYFPKTIQRGLLFKRAHKASYIYKHRAYNENIVSNFPYFFLDIPQCKCWVIILQNNQQSRGMPWNKGQGYKLQISHELCDYSLGQSEARDGNYWPMRGQQSVITRLFENITESYDWPEPILTTITANFKGVKMRR